jgi:tellurite resistance protein TehA-like permease
MRLNYLPSIIYFGMPMGLLGAGLNAHQLVEFFALEFDFSIILLSLGWVSFIFIFFHYVWHLIRVNNRSQLVQEWYDPFRRSFIPAVSLTLILFIISVSKVLGEIYTINQAWLLTSVLTVSVLHLMLNIFLINGWFFDSHVQLNHHKPTWFILLSANFIIVIALLTLFQPEKSSFLYELSFFFYAIAMFLWIAFTTSLFYKLIFDAPIQIHLRPSLFIFLAPPSLGCVASLFISDSYIATGFVTSEAIGVVTWASFSFASVMFIIWLFNYRFFTQSGLSMAGWSYVYPLAAYGLASQYLAQALTSQFLAVYSITIFVALIAFIVLLSTWFFRQAFLNSSKVPSA